jgi:hypothetical protein
VSSLIDQKEHDQLLYTSVASNRSSSESSHSDAVVSMSDPIVSYVQTTRMREIGTFTMLIAYMDWLIDGLLGFIINDLLRFINDSWRCRFLDDFDLRLFFGMRVPQV